MTNSNKIILGIIGAAAAGVVIGMLLAPEKSEEIRKKITDSASDLACRIGELVGLGKEKLVEAEDTLVHQAHSFPEKVASI